EGNAPSPIQEGLFAQRAADAQDQQQRQEEAHRGRGLDPACIEAATVLRSVLGHVGGGAAVFSAQRQALQQAQNDQYDRSGHADGGIRGQDTHQEGGQAHDQDGDKEGVLAADQVAQAAEYKRTEGADGKAGRKCQQGENEAGGGV